MIAFVGQLVCLFVRYARRGFSYSASLNLLAFVDVTVYFERSRSTFKVVCFVHDPLATAMARCKRLPVIIRALATVSTYLGHTGCVFSVSSQRVCFDLSLS